MAQDLVGCGIDEAFGKLLQHVRAAAHQHAVVVGHGNPFVASAPVFGGAVDIKITSVFEAWVGNCMVVEQFRQLSNAGGVMALDGLKRRASLSGVPSALRKRRSPAEFGSMGFVWAHGKWCSCMARH